MTIAVLMLIALLGAPLFAVIAAIAMLGFHDAEIDLAVMAVEVYRLAETPMLLAIPLFTFAGVVLGESGAPQRLVALSQAVFGTLPGGLAIVAIVMCAFFTAFTGASGVTLMALGTLLLTALHKAGYHERFSLGLLTSCGSLGLLFAPSLPLILYGIVAQQLPLTDPVGIDDLFLAGIVPGMLMIVVLAAYALWQSRPVLSSVPGDKARLWPSIKAARWELPLPWIVLGGIYSGFFAVSEAAAVTAIYVLLVEVLIYRDVAWREIPRLIREAMVLVGGILIILAVSLALTNYLIDSEVPGRLFQAIRQVVDSKWTFLILLNLFLLALGMMLDIFSAIVIMIPIILPVAVQYGIHPVHLGMIFLANMQIGYFTPPVGMNLFIASYRFNTPVITLYHATLPFFLLLLGVVLLITYFPALSLFLIEQ